MASELVGGDESKGSLFEGLVLFTFSDLSQPPDLSPPPASPPPPSRSQPLDEDLFLRSHPPKPPAVWFGRMAAEAKALNIGKEVLQNRREKAVSDLEKLEEVIKGILNRIQESKILISQKEKEAARTSFKSLQLVAAADARAEGGCS